MASTRYQYETSPRKVIPEVERQKSRKKQKVPKRSNLRVVENVQRQEVKISKVQRKKQLKLTMFAILAFLILIAIGYQNSQINVKFNEMQSKKKQLASLEKENEQLKINIENSLNISNIEKEAKEQLGMQKLTNKQTVYISLPKKNYVEAAKEKVIIKEEKTWLEKIMENIFGIK